MDIKKIGIIGITGLFGSWFKRFFEQHGCEVDGTSLESSRTIEEVVTWADVVIFCVPLNVLVDVIMKAIPFSRSDQLWMDIGSRKEKSIAVMCLSKAEVCGLHPLFATSEHMTDWQGKKVAVCEASLNEWTDWFWAFIGDTKTTPVKCTPEEHDVYMLANQNLFQISTLAVAMVLKQIELEPKLLVEFSTVSGENHLKAIARTLSQKPDVYADIQIGDCASIEIIEAFIVELREWQKCIECKNREEFIARMNELREHFHDSLSGLG